VLEQFISFQMLNKLLEKYNMGGEATRRAVKADSLCCMLRQSPARPHKANYAHRCRDKKK